jgi:hypothetical protein
VPPDACRGDDEAEEDGRGLFRSHVHGSILRVWGLYGQLKLSCRLHLA